MKNYFISSAKVLQKSEKQKDFSKKILFFLCFIYYLLNFRMWFKYGLKAQKLLAQGIALGNVDKKQSRPERAKALILKAFALSGRLFCICFKTQDDALG